MPNLVDRFKLARKAVVGQYDKDSATQAFGLLSGIYPAARGEPPQRGTLERLDGYNTMPWLRACAERVASSIASVQWQLFYQRSKSTGKVVHNKSLQRANYKDRARMMKNMRADKDADDLVPVESHPLIDLVLEGGNGYLSGFTIRKVTALYMDLVGETFWIKERDGLGTVVRVWPIPSHWIIGTATPSHRFFRVGYRSWVGDIPDTEMLWMANVNPVQPYGRGTGLAGTLADELETDEYAARFLKQFFYNDATPSFIVAPEGNGPADVLGETEIRRLEQGWLSKLQGYWKAHRPLFAQRSVKIIETTKSDLRSLQMVQIREHERNVIMQTWGIPPEMLGVIEKSNRSTIDNADYIFARHVEVPRLEFLRAELQLKLVPEYDERLILDYVSPIEDDHESQANAATTAPWCLTLNEWRMRCGEGPQPNGDYYMVPFTLQPRPTIDVPELGERQDVHDDTMPEVTPPQEDDTQPVDASNGRPRPVAARNGRRPALQRPSNGDTTTNAGGKAVEDDVTKDEVRAIIREEVGDLIRTEMRRAEPEPTTALVRRSQPQQPTAADVHLMIRDAVQEAVRDMAHEDGGFNGHKSPIQFNVPIHIPRPDVTVHVAAPDVKAAEPPAVHVTVQPANPVITLPAPRKTVKRIFRDNATGLVQRVEETPEDDVLDGTTVEG